MLDTLRQRTIRLTTRQKQVLAICIDIVLIPFALWFAFLLRLGSEQMINPLDYWWLFAAAVVTAVPVFIRLGLYRAILRYMGRDAITSIFKAVSISALLLALSIYIARSDLLIPRTLVFIYWITLFASIGGVRFAARSFLVPDPKERKFSRHLFSNPGDDGRQKVAIYGAGAAGFQLFRSVQQDSLIKPVAFVDDQRDLSGRSIGGLRVYRSDSIDQMLRETHATEIFLAIPSLNRRQRHDILEKLRQYPIKVRTVPTIQELMSGRKSLEQLQEIPIEDLLGREPVPPDPGLLTKCVTGRAIMVTGAGGSIGSELCRQILELKPSVLILFDNSEYNLFCVEEELRNHNELTSLGVAIAPVLGSVLNTKQLIAEMRRYKVDTIFHAAAYKHVHIVEQNISEGIRNNILGTWRTAAAAMIAGVHSFVLISTDKAVRPTNVMGASKRFAELILQALPAHRELTLPIETLSLPNSSSNRIVNTTAFTMVRFGNVIGSSGSVIPKFRDQIRRGGPITVTHPEVIRYFMTIPEAAQLVIQAGAMGTGGDVFVLNMGEPIRILDIATQMIHFSGHSAKDENHPNGDIEIAFTGLRPGEKLYEELLIGKEVLPTGHPMIMRAHESSLSWEKISDLLSELSAGLLNNDSARLKQILVEHVEGYRPYSKELQAVSTTPETRSTGKVIHLSLNRDPAAK